MNESKNLYGGNGNPFEARKVIEAWNLNFYLGSAVKHLLKEEYCGDRLRDFELAIEYLQYEIERRKAERAAMEALHAVSSLMSLKPAIDASAPPKIEPLPVSRPGAKMIMPSDSDDK